MAPSLSWPRMLAYAVVTGLPGSGKSTLAGPLSAALALPLISKDTVKEALASAEPGSPLSPERSRRLGAAAFEVVFALAAVSNGAVLEASWEPVSAQERLDALPGILIEVHCACPPDLAKRRYRLRAGDRHPVHLDADRFDDAALWSGGDAIGLSDPVIEVDCTVPVDIEPVATAVRSHPGWN